jgi:hypothetical protein
LPNKAHKEMAKLLRIYIATFYKQLRIRMDEFFFFFFWKFSASLRRLPALFSDNQHYCIFLSEQKGNGWDYVRDFYEFDGIYNHRGEKARGEPARVSLPCQLESAPQLFW